MFRMVVSTNGSSTLVSPGGEVRRVRLDRLFVVELPCFTELSVGTWLFVTRLRANDELPRGADWRTVYAGGASISRTFWVVFLLELVTFDLEGIGTSSTSLNELSGSLWRISSTEWLSIALLEVWSFGFERVRYTILRTLWFFQVSNYCSLDSLDVLYMVV